MTVCDRISLADLVEYRAGDLRGDEAEALEGHLFSCEACSRRAEEVDALAAGVSRACRGGRVHGFVTEGVLNRLGRDGVRVRSYALTPGDVVPCAVWADDEVMVLRLRGDFTGVREVTVVQRVGGSEISRASGLPPAPVPDELLFAVPAERVRQLPATDIEVTLVGEGPGGVRRIGTYILRHAGSFHREDRGPRMRQ